MLLRIVLAPDDIRKVVVEGLPESVEDLKLILKSKFNLDGEFVLQYEDPDFGNDLVNLTSLTDLPKERVTLKIVQKAPPSQQFNDSSINDTSSLTATPGQTKSWPEPFIIPRFSYDVELKLEQANDAHTKDGSLLDVTKELKTEILNKLANVMYNLNPYPSREQIEGVAKALVEKHPCLKEPGSSCGWYCWKFSLSFKMGNFRQKLRIAGCTSVSVKRSADGTGKKIKKPRRSETNFLPNMPDGETTSSLEEDRKALLLEMKKKNPNFKSIDTAMANTYALRRKEVIDNEPLVSEIQSRWPALFSERQV